jgi:acyl-CoA thioesterase
MFPEDGIREVNQALTYVVQEMRDGELYSDRLVAAALRSPVISTRNQGLNAVQARSREHWGETVEVAVTQLLSDEPDEKVLARVEALLN